MKIPARFVTSAAKPADFPPPSLPEVAVVGRSNVGKSSLINALVGQDGLARTSRTPGRTRLINWFEIGSQPPFFLVDLPGYGYADVSQAVRETWRPMIQTYLEERKTLAGVLLLVDIRRNAEDEEQDFVPWLSLQETPIVVALTKADKLPKNKRVLEVARAKKLLGVRREPICVSTLSGDGIAPLIREVLALAGRKREPRA
ncbi:MAG TPA: ribosome biogenesis GTP-binding protein YihA/YsxC [Kofleriaceae bacterium]|nr:ribosome biogenesis GTP-binding protein YihA/YsxC [Kofleriaceae bacterium]